MYGFRIRVRHKGRHGFSSVQVHQALLDEWLSGKNLILYSSQAGTVVINPTSAVIIRGLCVSRLNWVPQFPYSSILTLLVCLRCNKLYHINLNFFRDFSTPEKNHIVKNKRNFSRVVELMTCHLLY